MEYFGVHSLFTLFRSKVADANTPRVKCGTSLGVYEHFRFGPPKMDKSSKGVCGRCYRICIHGAPIEVAYVTKPVSSPNAPSSTCMSAQQLELAVLYAYNPPGGGEEAAVVKAQVCTVYPTAAVPRAAYAETRVVYRGPSCCIITSTAVCVVLNRSAWQYPSLPTPAPQTVRSMLLLLVVYSVDTWTRPRLCCVRVASRI